MEKLLEYLKAERGRATALASALKITPGAVAQWREVPADRLIEVERITGIARHDLRPDLYEGWQPADSRSPQRSGARTPSRVPANNGAA